MANVHTTMEGQRSNGQESVHAWQHTNIRKGSELLPHQKSENDTPLPPLPPGHAAFVRAELVLVAMDH